MSGRIGALSLVLLLMQLSACGFEPVYRKHASQLDLRASLSHLAIETPNSREGDQLKAHLEDAFLQHFAPTDPRYVLRIQVNTEQRPFIIGRDGISLRYDLVLSSTYQLVRLSDGQMLDEGQMRRYVSYNVSEDNDYATYISQRDAKKRGIKALAEDYQHHLAAKISRAIGTS